MSGIAGVSMQTIEPSSAKTGTGTSGNPIQGCAGWRRALFLLDVTATSVPTSCDVWIQTSVDGTNYTDVAHFTQSTAAGRWYVRARFDDTPTVTAEVEQAKAVAAATVRQGPIGDFLRVAWTIVGTSFTFSVKAQASE